VTRQARCGRGPPPSWGRRADNFTLGGSRDRSDDDLGGECFLSRKECDGQAAMKAWCHGRSRERAGVCPALRNPVVAVNRSRRKPREVCPRSGAPAQIGVCNLGLREIPPLSCSGGNTPPEACGLTIEDEGRTTRSSVVLSRKSVRLEGAGLGLASSAQRLRPAPGIRSSGPPGSRRRLFFSAHPSSPRVARSPRSRRRFCVVASAVRMELGSARPARLRRAPIVSCVGRQRNIQRVSSSHSHDLSARSRGRGPKAMVRKRAVRALVHGSLVRAIRPRGRRRRAASRESWPSQTRSRHRGQ